MSDDNQAADQPRVGSAVFWRLMALLNIVTVAWVVYVVWEIAPSTVVNEFVGRRVAPPPGAGTISGVASPVSPEAASPGSGSPTSQGSPALAPLRMETELTTKTIEQPAARK